jgi:hypothetical protein
LDADAHRMEFFAAHPMPLLQNQGGPVLRNPRIVAVFFGDDPLQRETEMLLQSYGCTNAWRQAVAEYGVGDAIYERSVVIPTFPDVDSVAKFEDWMKLEADALGLRGDQRTFIFYVPKGAFKSDDACTSEFGYHTSMTLGVGELEHEVVYALVEQCRLSSGATLLNQRAHTTAHELMEMAVDPYPSTNPGWKGIDNSRISLDLASQAADENADLCNDLLVVPSDYPFPVASGWSNRRAQAGFDPCTPSDRPFAVAYPQQTSVDLSNGSAEFAVDFYAEDPNARFLTFANSVAYGKCVGAMVIPNVRGETLVADGDSVRVALRVLPAECRTAGSGKPRVVIVLTTEDGQQLQQLIVELTGV